MLKDITLGQFFPGDSLLHRADPRAKLLLTIVFIVMLFVCGNFVSFAFALVFSILLVFLSKISFKTIFKGIKPVLFVLLFTFFINLFFTVGDTLLFEFYFIKLYAEGIYRAFVMALRITLLISVTCMLMSYTTSPIKLTDAIEQLLSPLKIIKLPVHEFAMMMTIALRFIPTLVEETDKIMTAQKARGADFSEGSILKRAKSLVPILIPLFVSSFRRADELAIAMECRCYRGGSGRTRMTKLKYSKYDLFLLFLFIVFVCVIISCNIFFYNLSF